MDTLEPEIKQSRIPPWAKKVIPVIVSILILYYYFRDMEWGRIVDSCSRADLLIAVLAIVIPQLITWFLGTLMVERHIRWFHGPFPFWKYFWVKGAIYILMFINVYIGGGGMLLYQQRRAQITWRKLMGIAMFRLGLVLWGMAVILIPATLAMQYFGLAEKARINMSVWWFLLIGGVAWMTEAWLFWHHKVNTGLSRLVVRDRESEFWTAFNTATRRQWLLTWAMTLPPFVLTIVSFYFLNLAFDVNVPFFEFMVVGPIALMIMDLPIAFGGFGTATIAWMTFFGDYGSPENIVALTLFLPFSRAVFRSLLGLVSLRPALREISTLSLRASQPETATPLEADTKEV